MHTHDLVFRDLKRDYCKVYVRKYSINNLNKSTYINKIATDMVNLHVHWHLAGSKLWMLLFWVCSERLDTMELNRVNAWNLHCGQHRAGRRNLHHKIQLHVEWTSLRTKIQFDICNRWRKTSNSLNAIMFFCSSLLWTFQVLKKSAFLQSVLDQMITKIIIKHFFNKYSR